MTDMSGSSSSNAHSRYKEWDQISCPICVDHPHNAVLLICSSHNKGCRSFICDTSYRHSNCLDRFRSRKKERDESLTESISLTSGQILGTHLSSETHFGSPITQRLASEASNEYSLEEANESAFSSVAVADQIINTINTQEAGSSGTQQEERIDLEGSVMSNLKSAEAHNLKCPLCRGVVLGWIIVKEIRQYLDLKLRGCSRESCTFSGNYRELRSHARRVHPTTRPGDVDPTRQRAWRRLQHQREYGDILSAIRSATPGAIVLGDYVIENEDGREREGMRSGEGSGQWWTTFLLFQMISNPVGSLDESRSNSRQWRSHRRLSGNRYAWGERLLPLADEDHRGARDNDDIPEMPRRRRRFMRSRDNDEHQGRNDTFW